ncbi:hypothetical protein AMTRI_Chr13g125110 [Amborella trichopoda]
MNNRNAQNPSLYFLSLNLSHQKPITPNPISVKTVYLLLPSFNTERTKNPKSHLCKKHPSFAPIFNIERTENPKSHLSKKPSILVVNNPKSYLCKKPSISVKKPQIPSLNRCTFSFDSKPDLSCINGRTWMRKKSFRNEIKWLRKKSCMV